MKHRKSSQNSHLSPPTASLSGLHILHVDTCPHARAVIRNMLISLGITSIKSVDRAGFCFEHLRRKPFDLIFYGRSACGLKDTHFTYALRHCSDIPNRFIPVVKVCSQEAAPTEDRAGEVGIVNFFGKPVTPSALSLKIDAVIKNPKAQELTNSFSGPDPMWDLDSRPSRR